MKDRVAHSVELAFDDAHQQIESTVQHALRAHADRAAADALRLRREVTYEIERLSEFSRRVAALRSVIETGVRES
jgi:hypothetical protein